MAASMNALRVTDSQEHASLPGEIWKPVPSEAGVLASSAGRILLPPRYAPMKHGGFRAYFPKPRYGQVSREMKTAKHSYKIIMVRREGAAAMQSPRKVHQLVCEAFHGPRPFPEAVVIHINEDAHDNRPENLKWGTQKENLNAPKFLANMRKAPLYRKCEHCGVQFRRRDVEQRFCSPACYGVSCRSYSEDVPEKVAAMLEAGMMQKDIAIAVGVKASAVQRIIAKLKKEVRA